jgi:hypothetical protein
MKDYKEKAKQIKGEGVHAVAAKEIDRFCIR